MQHTRYHHSSPQTAVLTQEPAIPRFTARVIALALLTACLITATHTAAQTPLGDPPDLVDPKNDDDVMPINVRQNWGLINQSGRLTALPIFDWADYGFESMIRVVAGGKTGFVYPSGKFIIDPIFDEADRFEEHYAIFKAGEKYGYIDRRGKIRLQPQLDGALRFKDGFAGVRVGDRFGYIDQRFKLVIPAQFVRVRSFHQSVAAVTLPGNEKSFGPVAYIDKTGKFQFKDDTRTIKELGDFHEDVARFRVGQLWGYMDRGYRPVIPPTFQDARDFTNGLAAVKLGEHWGFIDRSASLVVPAIYDEADDMELVAEDRNAKLAMVKRNGKWGFVDRVGREVIPLNFAWAEPYRFGYAKVGVGDNFLYLGSSGVVLWDPRSAEDGIVDRTSTGQALRAAQNPKRRSRSLLAPPAPLPVKTPPYAAEHLYDEGIGLDDPEQEKDEKDKKKKKKGEEKEEIESI